MLKMDSRSAYSEEHGMFREQVRKFLARHVTPHADRWEEAGIVDRSVWNVAGEAGLLCPTVPEEYGGLGVDFGYNAVIDEEVAYQGATLGFSLQSDIVADYLVAYGSEEQKRHWLPRMVSGETVTAIAMTEPGAGSDLQGIRTTARRDGNHYVVKGSKTYITNGQTADLIIVVAKTDPERGAKGTSLILVEADREGFARGRNLDKIGQNSADTSELFFDDVRVPITNCLGAWKTTAFIYLMSQLPQERLSIAVGAQAAAQRAFDETVKFVPRSARRSARPCSIFRTRVSRWRIWRRRLQVGLGAYRLVPGAPFEKGTDRGGRVGCQIVAHRNAVGSGRCRAAASWRRRLYERIPDCADVAGCASAADLRRHKRDHEGSGQPLNLADDEAPL